MQTLRAHNVSFEKENAILKNFSFTFDQQLYGILSDQPTENSTILKVLAGLLKPSAGTIEVDGKNVFTSFQKRERTIRKQIGFVFQSGGLLSNLSVQENLLLPFDFHFSDVPIQEKLKKILSYFEMFGLSEKILGERPAKLTISMRKALLFIRTYLTEPKIIFYDDPCMNCSHQVKKSVFEMIIKLKNAKTVQVFSESVDLHLYGLAEKVLLLKEGELHAAATLNELKILTQFFLET